MASAVTGFMRTFGMDEPMGCYDDIEAADAFVLWGSNMAEMHPILWTRVTDRRLSAPHVKVAVLSVYEHRSHDLSDLTLTFRPQTDLAMLNYIANYIIQNDKVDKAFLDRHARFVIGNTDIGYGLRPGASAAAEGEELPTIRRQPAGDLRGVREVREPVRPGIGGQARQRAQGPARAPRRRCTPTRRPR